MDQRKARDIFKYFKLKIIKNKLWEVAKAALTGNNFKCLIRKGRV